ncbi:MAG: hypothetical protein KF819_08390 [Labilithrix sp.]|nr:hypothetical protein [Labilithrix sp.]
MLRIQRLAVATLSVLGLTGYAHLAHADAALGAPAPACQVSIANAGADGVMIPSNAPALLIVETTTSGPLTVNAELISSTERLPFAAPSNDVNGLRILPLPSNTPGAYSVELGANCGTMEQQPYEIPLTLTAPVDFPTTVGTLVHVPKNPPTGVETIDLEPSEGLRAFLPATQLKLSVDGATGGARNGGASSKKISFTANTGSACVENGALHREKRVVRVSLAAAIAGVSTSPAPATLDVEVDCGAIKWTSLTEIPGESTSGSASSTPGSSSSSGGGCSAAPVTGLSGTASAVAALALASLVARRRRR